MSLWTIVYLKTSSLQILAERSVGDRIGASSINEILKKKIDSDGRKEGGNRKILLFIQTEKSTPEP